MHNSRMSTLRGIELLLLSNTLSNTSCFMQCQSCGLHVPDWGTLTGLRAALAALISRGKWQDARMSMYIRALFCYY